MAAIVALAALVLARLAAAQSCAVKFSTSGSWQSGGKTYFSLNGEYSNTGSKAVSVPWTLTISNSAYAAVTQVSSISCPVFSRQMLLLNAFVVACMILQYAGQRLHHRREGGSVALGFQT